MFLNAISDVCFAVGTTCSNYTNFELLKYNATLIFLTAVALNLISYNSHTMYTRIEPVYQNSILVLFCGLFSHITRLLFDSPRGYVSKQIPARMYPTPVSSCPETVPAVARCGCLAGMWICN